MADKKEEKESEKTENIVAFVALGLVIFVFIGFWFQWWGLFGTGEIDTDNPIVATSTAGEPVKGDPNAPITIIEFSDFECPFCGRWFEEVYPQLKETYIDTGIARVVFKQFPLTRIHPRAMISAVATECAYRQGNDFFWDYHDLLFTNQDALDTASLKKYGSDVGLNQLQFELCLTNQETEAEVGSDFAEGTNAGVTGTPAFIIGRTQDSGRGELIIGAQPFAKFQEAIERLT